jgi:hypothetical protein
MSFKKAQHFMDLATFAARHLAVTLDDVGERFGISKRTAQRILHGLEVQFPDEYETRYLLRLKEQGGAVVEFAP